MRTKSTRLDVVGFHKSLDGTRKARKLNWKQVAKETGVGASTLTRMAGGNPPDATALAVLARWANVDPKVFLTDEGQPATESCLGEVLGRIRSDKTIPLDVKSMLETVIASAMERTSKAAAQQAADSSNPKV